MFRFGHGISIVPLYGFPGYGKAQTTPVVLSRFQAINDLEDIPKIKFSMTKPFLRQ
jgi:hypothetical protein